MGAAIPLILGGITAAGGIIGGERANAANATQSREQMEFQERMRKTQYQTAVEDMKKAGLNPALAYQQGGAGTPSGAQATMQNTVGPAISTAVGAAQTAAAVRNTEAQTNQINIESAEKLRNLKNNTQLVVEQEKEKRRMNTIGDRTMETTIEAIQKQLDNLVENTREVRSRATLNELKQPGAKAQAESDKTLWGKYVRPYIHDAKSARQVID